LKKNQIDKTNIATVFS